MLSANLKGDFNLPEACKVGSHAIVPSVREVHSRRLPLLMPSQLHLGRTPCVTPHRPPPPAASHHTTQCLLLLKPSELQLQRRYPPWRSPTPTPPRRLKPQMRRRTVEGSVHGRFHVVPDLRKLKGSRDLLVMRHVPGP